MAYTQQKDGAIVINGWEKGIAASPYQGIGDIKCANITTIPGEVSVNYARSRQSFSPIVNGIISMGIGNIVVQTSGTAMTEGMFVIVSNSTITGLANGSYFVVSSGGSNYQFYTSYFTGIQTATVAGTATINSFDMGELIYYTKEKVTASSYRYYVLDTSGRVWLNTTGNTKWYMLENTGYTNPGGLVAYKGYLFILYDAGIDYKSTSALGTAWSPWVSGGAMATGNIPRHAIAAHDDSVYFCNGRNIGEFFENAGTTFNPTNSATYTRILQALYLPSFETATRLGEQTNNDLIVGCVSNSLFTWDKITTLAVSPMLLPEANTVELLTVNNIVYIFCGSKGNVYLTNGSNITNVLTIPDYITGIVEPYFVWHSAMYLRGRIWCSIQAANCGGVWSFVPTTSYYAQQSNAGSSLRLEAQNSYGTYNGAATLLFAPQEMTGQDARGAQYWTAWESAEPGNCAIDFSSTTPYTGGQTVIETDIIPVGTFLNKKTFNQIEFKLATPLVSGESVEVQYRTNITDAFISVGINSTVGALSDYFSVNFQTSQWLQLKIILTSTATNPSFVRLTEVRII